MTFLKHANVITDKGHHFQLYALLSFGWLPIRLMKRICISLVIIRDEEIA